MQRVRSGLTVLFWATLLGDVAQVAVGATSSYLFRLLREGYSTGSRAFESLQLVHHASLAVSVVVAVASMVGLALVNRAPEADRLRLRALSSFAMTGVGIDFAVMIAQNLGLGSGPPAAVRQMQIGLWILIAMSVVGGALRLVLCRRVAAAGGRPLPLWVSAGVVAELVWMVAGAAAAALWPTFVGSLVRQAIYAVLALPMLAALWLATQARPLPSATACVPAGLGASPLAGPAWHSVASGLARYRGAVLAKLVVLVGSVALLAAAISGNSGGLARAVGIGAPVVDLVLTVVLIVALVDYGAVPDETGARATATLAVVSAVFTLCTQLYAGWLLWQLFGASEASDFRALEAAQARLPIADGVAQLSALAGLLLLLASFRALALWIDLPQLARRTGWASAAVGVTMLAALLFRGYLAHGLDDAPASQLVTWGALVLALAVATLVIYLGIVGALVVELRARVAAATSATP